MEHFAESDWFDGRMRGDNASFLLRTEYEFVT